MSQQIRKRSLKQFAVDGDKLRLEDGQSVRALTSSQTEVSLIKLGTDNKVMAFHSVNNAPAEIAFKADMEAYTNQKIEDLVNFAPAALDTLKEIADALGSDANFSATIIGQIGSLATRIGAEESARDQADQQHSGDIASLQSKASTSESDISSLAMRIGAEENSRTTSDQQQNGEIFTLQNRVFSTESDISSLAMRVGAEENSRVSSDQVHTGDIFTLQNRVFSTESDISSLAMRVGAEENSRVSNDQVHAGEIFTLQNRAFASEEGISSLAMRVGAEENSRVSNDQVHAGEIFTLQNRAFASEEGISSLAMRVGAEENSRVSNDQVHAGEIFTLQNRAFASEEGISSLAMRVGAEENSRSQADQSLASRIGDVETALDFVKDNSDQLAIDSLTEIIAAFQQADGSLAGAISALGAGEASRAMAAEASLNAKIMQEISDRSADVDAEQSRAESVELTLQQQISAEISNREADVNAEESRALAAESSLNSKLMQEISDREADVNAEESRALAAESSLNSKLSQEISDREADVNAEESRALAAESSLNSKLMQEISDREADVNAEESRAMGVELTLQQQIDAEKIAREGDVDAEQSRAEGVEQSLQAQIDTKINNTGDFVTGEYIFDEGETVVKSILTDRIRVDQDLGYTNVYTELKSDRLNVKSSDGMLSISGNSIFLSHVVPAESGLPEAGYSVLLETDGNTMRLGQTYNYNGETLPYLPVQDHEFAVKKYVDVAIASVQSQINDINAEIDGPYFEKESVTISDASTFTGITLAYAPAANSCVVSLGRLMLHEGSDFTVSGSTITLTGDVAYGQVESIENGDVLYVSYARTV